MPCKPTNFPNGINAGACLEADSDAIILLPHVSVEVSADYTQLPKDDIIWCSGSLTVTLLDPTEAIKSVIIRSLSGTVTLDPSSGTTETTTLTTAQAQRLGPRATGWFNL